MYQVLLPIIGTVGVFGNIETTSCDECAPNGPRRRQSHLLDLSFLALASSLSLRQRRSQLEFHLFTCLALQCIASKCNKYIHKIYILCHYITCERRFFYWFFFFVWWDSRIKHRYFLISSGLYLTNLNKYIDTLIRYFSNGC